MREFLRREEEEVRRRIAQHGRWFHEIEVAPGILTPGEDSNRLKLPILDAIGLPKDAKGLRVLDVGCSDGYFTFEMENRGADVVGVDFVSESATGFSVAKDLLGSRAAYRVDNVYNISPRDYGTFDVILFLGVLYHLRKPLTALDALRSVLREGGELFIATLLIDDFVLLPDGTSTRLEALNPLLKSIPIWQAYPEDSLNGDFTNCFAPNAKALEVALLEAQFRVEEFRKLDMGGYARARAVSNPSAARYRDLDSRIEKSPFDPSIPYFLDEDQSKLTITGAARREGTTSKPSET